MFLVIGITGAIARDRVRGIGYGLYFESGAEVPIENSDFFQGMRGSRKFYSLITELNLVMRSFDNVFFRSTSRICLRCL